MTTIRQDVGHAFGDNERVNAIGGDRVTFDAAAGDAWITRMGRLAAAGAATVAVLVAGLRGGGWQGGPEALMTVEIGGGPVPLPPVPIRR